MRSLFHLENFKPRWSLCKHLPLGRTSHYHPRNCSQGKQPPGSCRLVLHPWPLPKSCASVLPKPSLRAIPEWRSNGNIRYRISGSLKASIGWRYASRPNSDLFGQVRGRAYGFQSEYLTFDTRLSWALVRRMELSAGIDNLLNYKAYVAHPLPQRTFVLDLKTKW